MAPAYRMRILEPDSPHSICCSGPVAFSEMLPTAETGGSDCVAIIPGLNGFFRFPTDASPRTFHEGVTFLAANGKGDALAWNERRRELVVVPYSDGDGTTERVIAEQSSRPTRAALGDAGHVAFTNGGRELHLLDPSGLALDPPQLDLRVNAYETVIVFPDGSYALTVQASNSRLHSFLIHDGKCTSIPGEEFPSVRVYAGSRSFLVGAMFSDTRCDPFAWTAATGVLLLPTGEADGTGVASNISSTGDIVGHVAQARHPDQPRACLWRYNELFHLNGAVGQPADSRLLFARAAGPNGKILATCALGSDDHAWAMLEPHDAQ